MACPLPRTPLAVPRLYMAPEALSGEIIVLRGERYRYVCRVLRLGENDEIFLFDGRGRELRARIREVKPNAVEIAIEEEVALAPTLRATIDLMVGLPKGDKADLIVEKTTELGVSRIRFVETDRSVPERGAQALARRQMRWR